MEHAPVKGLRAQAEGLAPEAADTKGAEALSGARGFQGSAGFRRLQGFLGFGPEPPQHLPLWEGMKSEKLKARVSCGATCYRGCWLD